MKSDSRYPAPGKEPFNADPEDLEFTEDGYVWPEDER
jgi:hypothetical protein